MLHVASSLNTASEIKYRGMKSYRDLDIYQIAYRLAVNVHRMTLTLPKYEMYEQGSQVRRSTKSIKDNIVEGYGRKRYKLEFVRYLVFAHASCDEAISQLTMIDEIHFESKGLTDLISEYEILGRKIYKFIEYVEKNWNEPTT
jgi:four helix bundle protein